MTEHNDLSGDAALGVADCVNKATRRFAATQIDPFTGRPGAAASVVPIDTGPTPSISWSTVPRATAS